MCMCEIVGIVRAVSWSVMKMQSAGWRNDCLTMKGCQYETK